jgi:hypothetical protein
MICDTDTSIKFFAQLVQSTLLSDNGGSNGAATEFQYMGIGWLPPDGGAGESLLALSTHPLTLAVLAADDSGSGIVSSSFGVVLKI